MPTNRWMWTVILIVFSSIVSCRSAPEAGQNWTHRVRIAGHGLSLENVDEIVTGATETHVFGIETDNDITGRYLSFLDPTVKLAAIRAVAERAHAADNRAFVYIAGLEIITPEADTREHTFYKDHPDWVQQDITGRPAIFGGEDAFWIRAGDEDVWITPYAREWREIYMQRVREIAATGIDGIYVDIPYWMTHFEGWWDTWASFDEHTVAAFKQQTGLDPRSDIRLGDYDDPGFISWIDFRIQTITDFMAEIDSNVKAVNPECKTIAEIYPGLGEDAVRVGADVYQLYPVVDAIGHEYSEGAYMAAARAPLDWFHYLVGMYTFRAFAEGKASWMLSYSWDGEQSVPPAEAMKMMFLSHLTAGTNTWDAQGHVMSRSNDYATRQEVFRWIAEHENTFYLPREPINPVGIYFSPTSRNYFTDQFLPSYRGMLILALQTHIEFQVVTPRTLENFDSQVLILPNVMTISDREVELLGAYLDRGHRIIATGECGTYDDQRKHRGGATLDDLLEGTARQLKQFPVCPGKAFLATAGENFDQQAETGQYDATEFHQIGMEFRQSLVALDYESALTVEAPPFVSAQIARVGGQPHVFLANFSGIVAGEQLVPDPVKDIRLTFPVDGNSRVYWLPYLGEVEQLPATREGDKLVCTIPALERGAVIWSE